MKMNDWKVNERLKIERTLNFSTITHEEDDLCYSRRKVARQDPMSHRIIEKRRRDRMNNCLADLSRLIPHHYMKKSRGRIEKTEIIEMAIKHLKHLQAHSCKDLANCDVAKATEQEWQHQYRLGFQECTSEVVRFLVESEGLFPAEGVCFRLMTHLQEHYDKLTRGCYSSGRASQQLVQEDNSSTQMDIDNASTLNGSVTDGFSVTSVKRTTSPPAYDIQPEPSPAVQQQPPNREPPVDDSCLVPASSQLREMLQNPNVPVERMRSNSASSTTSGYSSRPFVTMYDNYPKGQSCEEVYKFKKNIKDRFNADLHQNVDEMPAKFSIVNVASSSANPVPFPGPAASNCGTSALMVTSTSLLETQNPNNIKNDSDNNSNNNNIDVCPNTVNDGDMNSTNSQNDPQTDSSNGSSSPVSNGRSNGSSSGYSTSGDAPNRIKLHKSKSRTPDRSLYPRHANYLTNGNRPDSPYLKSTIVPIFALHPKGNFYIPLSLESDLIAPYLYSVDSNSPVLHPVSISVNFCGPSNFSTPEHLNWQPQHSIPSQIQPNCYDRYHDQSY